MVIAVSQEFKDALNVSHTKVSEFTVTPPGAETTTFQCTTATVSSSADSGTRYRASLNVVPQPGVDLYSILSAPGARFQIRHGINFGAGVTELIDLGHYEASAGSINIIDGDISVSLVDQWVWLERTRAASPTTVNGGDWDSRAALIAVVVDAAYPVGVTAPTVVIEDDGGSFFTELVFDKERTELIKQLALDGELDVYFNASGEFIIRKQPIISPTDVAWTYRTGGAGNIDTADRERPFDRLYNTVAVAPIAEEQTWTIQIAEITDTTHPRHKSKIGVVPYLYSSPTLGDDSEALAAAETILQRVQGTTETVSITGLGAPQLEVGDSITIAHAETESDPGFNATHIIDSFDYDLASGSMTLKTRSDSLAEVAEA
jgi:hypothetical protein